MSGGQTPLDVRIALSGTWVALMLTYLLGDVLRILSGDADEFIARGFEGIEVTQRMWGAMAALMLVPIAMVVLTLILPYPAVRWVTLVAAALPFLLNAPGPADLLRPVRPDPHRGRSDHQRPDLLVRPALADLRRDRGSAPSQPRRASRASTRSTASPDDGSTPSSDGSSAPVAQASTIRMCRSSSQANQA